MRLVRSRSIATQEELLQAMRGLGFEVTQATLSRDLGRLGARRATTPGGGTRYDLPEDHHTDSAVAIGRLIASISHNGSLVVVRTHPGGAPTVARTIDLARFPEILGSIAGDDTIFLAPAGAVRAGALARKVRELFDLG